MAGNENSGRPSPLDDAKTQGQLKRALRAGMSWNACAELIMMGGADNLLHQLENRPELYAEMQAVRQRALLRMSENIIKGKADATQERFFRRVVRDNAYADIDALIRAGAEVKAAEITAAKELPSMKLDITLDPTEEVQQPPEADDATNPEGGTPA